MPTSARSVYGNAINRISVGRPALRPPPDTRRTISSHSVGADDPVRPISVIANQCSYWRGNPFPLPLPLGEVAERSEDGEGRNVKKTCRVDTLRKYASGIFLVSISAAMSCCGAQNFCAALRRALEILTAATRSPCFICHWQRTALSPPQHPSGFAPHHLGSPLSHLR